MPEDDDDPFADVGPGPDPFFPPVSAPSVWDDAPEDAPVDESTVWADVEPAPVAVPVPSAASGTSRARPPAFDEVRLLGAVGEHAGAVRRRRRARALGVMAVALVLLLVSTALRLGGRGEDVAAGSTSTTVAVSAVTDPPLLGVDAPPSTAVLPSVVSPVTPFPSTTRTAVAASSTSIRPTTTVDTRPAGDRPDGVAGWTTGDTTCVEAAEIPADGGAPTGELSIDAAVSATTVRGGGSVELTVTLTNRGPEPVTVFYRTPTSRTDAWFLGTPSRAASATLVEARTQRDALVVPPATVNGGRATLSRTIRAVRCGDTSTDEPPVLSSSTYLVGASLDVALTPGEPLQPWRTPQVQVVVGG